MMQYIKRLAVIAALAMVPALHAELVDVTNQPASSTTRLGDIDMKKGTVGDLSQFIAPSYSVVSNDAANALSKTNANDVVKDIVTNTVVVGYTDWTYSGDTTAGTSYSITFEPSGGDYVFTLWNASSGTSLGTSTTNIVNPTALSFSVASGMINAARNEIRRNSNGLAMYSDVQALEQKIDSMDTSYFRVVGITNKNQSVQYVYTDSSTTSLQIQLPEDGMTKDWLVYVLAETNLTLVLPPANYWCVNESATNDIPYSTPTALYFSQINDTTYSLGRQELIPVTVPTPLMLMNAAIREKMSKKPKFTTKGVKNAAVGPSNILTK